MDAQQKDAPLSRVQHFEVLEECSSSSYDLDVEALNRLIAFGREHNPRLKGASEARLAEMCQVSETTFKSIRKGRNKKPRVDILYSIVSLFGGSVDRLIGLAPTRDIARERAAWDGTLVDGYQQRIEALERQLSANEAELDRLRKRVLEESNERRSAEAKAKQLEERCALRRAEISEQREQYQAELAAANKRSDDARRLNVIMTTLLIAAIIAYVAYELSYIDNGLTGTLRRLLSKV